MIPGLATLLLMSEEGISCVGDGKEIESRRDLSE